ncbi:MAG: DUF3604 domain-containing protein [Anaerolineales bacterium]
MRQRLDLGNAEIAPTDPIVAGSFVTRTFTYTTGHPIDDTGFIKVAFRNAGDFGTPQFADPGAPNYCIVRTTGNCRIEPRWYPRGNRRPWGLSLYLQVMGGYLGRGDQVVVVFGDTTEGSPGWQAQTFVEDTFEFKTFVDPIATYQFKELSRSPEVTIVPGEATRAICLAPSQVQVGQEFSYHLKLEDRWGNPTGDPQAFAHPGFEGSGWQTVRATDAYTGLLAESNPIQVREGKAPHNPYWADFHGQTEETCGSGTIEQYFTFARGRGLLDIAGHQGNDFEISDALWRTINATTERFNAPGTFVTFPGYEWSGNTPLGGDRNVYFSSEGGEIVHSCTDLLPDKETAHPIAPTAEELFRELRQQEDPRPFAFAHVGGRYADLRMHDEEIEVAVEIHSAWGTYEWLLEEALERGYRVGICANSDGHKTRPGASYPGASTFGSLGGLTCVLAPHLDRPSVMEALQARHFYATTGHRPLLDVRLRGRGYERAMMGDVVPARDGVPELCVHAVGTAPIEAVQVRNGLETVATLRPYTAEELGRRVKIVWRGSEVRGRARQVVWDGALQVEGNAIADVAPVNFWNPNRPVRQPSSHRLTWESVTTGGLTGVILTLEEGMAGTLHIETSQGEVECDLASLGMEPRTWSYGGVDKELSLYRLPEGEGRRAFSFRLPVSDLHAGDNPLYVRLDQEDGHMAWSSPIYVVGS